MKFCGGLKGKCQCDRDRVTGWSVVIILLPLLSDSNKDIINGLAGGALMDQIFFIGKVLLGMIIEQICLRKHGGREGSGSHLCKHV